MDSKQAQAAIDALAPSNPFIRFLKEYMTARVLVSSILLPVAVALVPPLAPLVAADPQLAATIGGLLVAGVDVVDTYTKKRKTRKCPAPSAQPKSPA